MPARSTIGGAAALIATMTATAGAAVPVAPPRLPEAPILRAAGGCGPFYHRNRFGFCVVNGFYGGYYPGEVRRLPPPCPRFYHRDPDPARPICYPN